MASTGGAAGPLAPFPCLPVAGLLRRTSQLDRELQDRERLARGPGLPGHRGAVRNSDHGRGPVRAATTAEYVPADEPRAGLAADSSRHRLVIVSLLAASAYRRDRHCHLAGPPRIFRAAEQGDQYCPPVPGTRRLPPPPSRLGVQPSAHFGLSHAVHPPITTAQGACSDSPDMSGRMPRPRGRSMCATPSQRAAAPPQHRRDDSCRALPARDWSQPKPAVGCLAGPCPCAAKGSVLR